MGFFRFRRRFELLPGVHLNVGKTGLSLSAGVPGAEVTLGHTGARATAGIPGTGLSYTAHDPETRTPTSYAEISGKPKIAPEPDFDWKEYALAISELLPDGPEELRMYLAINGQTCGPYSFTQVVIMLANRTITPETVWTLSGEETCWKPLGDAQLDEIVESYRKVMELA